MLGVPPDHAHMILYKHKMSAEAAADAHLQNPGQHDPGLDANKGILKKLGYTKRIGENPVAGPHGAAGMHGSSLEEEQLNEAIMASMQAQSNPSAGGYEPLGIE